MCGRYETTKMSWREIYERYSMKWDDSLPDRLSPFEKDEIFPTDDAPVIYEQDGERQLEPMHWGWVREWAKRPLINAKGEEAAIKRTWKRALAERRCIIPATGFYEWTGAKGSKQRWKIELKSGEPMGLGGIWEEQDGEKCYSILTIGANEVMQPIHHRMPVIVKPDDADQWLGSEEFEALIEPYSSEEMKAYPVGKDLLPLQD